MNKFATLFLAAISLAATPLASRLVAATYEVGPAQTYTNLGSVPWTGLLPGDTVNIHFQPGGYHEIILLSNSGVSNSPITLNGVPDPVTGALPLLDGANAATATNVPWRAQSLNTEGVIVVSPSANQPYPYFPAWIVIQNLHVQNASPSNQLTTTSRVTANFATTAAAIYAEYAQHLVVSGCELNGSCNGFYCGAENGDPNTTSADILVQNCWIHGNGFPGNFEAHNIYTQAKGIVFQYNLIGPLDPSASGDDIRDGSSGTVLRYNLVVQGAGGMAFWFIQPDGGVGVIDQDPAYHTNFVYGNVFLNTTNSGALTMFAYDYLGYGSHPRNGTLYFYNNTVVNYADQSARYFTDIFQLPTHADAVAGNIHDIVDCRNNIFAAVPATAGKSPTQAYLLESDDGTIVLGTNWVTPGFITVQLPYGSTSFYGSITGTNQLIFGDQHGQNNPGFVSAANTNFNLVSSSPCIDAAAPQSPAVLASPNNVIAQYIFPTGGQLRTMSGLTMDLGAFEGVSTNYTGPLFSLTVNNGFGTGNYPSNALVRIAASNALPGRIFKEWTGCAVANPLSIGTTFSMPPGNVTVTATYSNVSLNSLFNFTVVSGIGSGRYVGGATIGFAANTPDASQTPGAFYSINQTAVGGSQQITTTPGGGLPTDTAGLLSFNNTGQSLAGMPRLVSAVWTGSNFRLTGVGMVNTTYTILATTNLAATTWFAVGSATADVNGSFQFTDGNTSFGAQRFYRVSWP